MRKDIKLKVCGMRDAENIIQLAALQPDYIGFIFYPESKRYVGEIDQNILKKIPSDIKKTGVFVNESYRVIVDKISDFKLDAIQLHGKESAEFCDKFRTVDVEVIKAVGISNPANFDGLNEYSDAVDYFLFDTKTQQHGGSGKTFDWSLLKCYTLNKPYFLSGGLSSEHLNDLSAIQDSRLYAFDLNSRFELEPGLKDIQKLRSFFNEIRVPV